MRRSLLAYINGAHVGTLSAEGNIWRFEYTQAWADDDDGYDLSPSLPRSNAAGQPMLHIDGSSTRPVQWYFDNLLPEEALRIALASQAEVEEGDAFGLLAYYGRESAGSLTLLREGEEPVAASMRPLPLEELSARIKAMPKVPLNTDSPKHMSLAGAQHKLAVIYKDGELFEPDGPTASTHILKPQHPEKDSYPSSVVNEYLTMRVAREVGLNPPPVRRLFCPEPVYLIERFDRMPNADDGVDRLHVIDGCQLLNIDRVFKYSAASVETLAQLVAFLHVPAAGRQWFFDWLVFNILMGNGDNHLKNISFMVSHNGIVISPCYDLLCTAAYDTKAVDRDFGEWSQTKFALTLGPEVRCFSDITRDAVIAAGITLGLGRMAAKRRLDHLIRKVPLAVNKVRREILDENAQQTEEAQWGLEKDSRMLGIIEHTIVSTMIKQLQEVPVS
ncbi:HipA domain-containing protein [Methylobacillus arboreus]|uniref:HipA domain-containing protein n=1 Tax=Methylobacillus arboreus TaxID=755170 RepID=UPI001E4DE89B|nr:HipA domain-containing protein [Methylobacillus arboreus]MCB5190665.1 HipA domain-containing protein [Methylobacillus arboreus]